MTDQDQRIALCEWAGFEPCHQPYGRFWYRPEGWPSSRSQPYDEFIHLPDTSSLDVLHEMESRMAKQDGALCVDYANHLSQLPDGGTASRFGLIHATASQRREALLRTLGLWKETT